jgi:hypothetical protein
MTAALRIAPYEPGWADRWDAFSADANNATIFHSQNFLAYHGQAKAGRFAHLLFLRGDNPAAVMPLGVDAAAGEAQSPWGASFGGPVLPRQTSYAEADEVAEAFLTYARAQGWRRVRITPAPAVYHAVPDAYLEFALLKRGFRLAKRELCQGVSLVPAGEDPLAGYDYACRKAIRKAGREGVEVRPTEDIELFHAILAESRARLGAVPTHTAAELANLRERIGKAFVLFGAYRGDELLGGLLGFSANARVFLNFYTCSRAESREIRVDNLLNHAALGWARDNGFKYYDFGTSSLDMRENEGLIRFKAGFGGGSHFRDTYVWDAA